MNIIAFLGLHFRDASLILLYLFILRINILKKGLTYVQTLIKENLLTRIIDSAAIINLKFFKKNRKMNSF